jgi:hypothetical protein
VTALLILLLVLVMFGVYTYGEIRAALEALPGDDPHVLLSALYSDVVRPWRL